MLHLKRKQQRIVIAGSVASKLVASICGVMTSIFVQHVGLQLESNNWK